MQVNLPGVFAPAPRGLRFDAPLPQGCLDIEDKTRTSVFAWRGQFSPQLVESLLSAYCWDGAHVLDPFSGSGTSLLESARLGMTATGFEINPAAWLLSRVYTLCNVSREEREVALRTISRRVSKLWDAGGVESAELGLQEMASQDGVSGIVAGALVILLDLFTNDLTIEHCQRTLLKLTRSIRDLPFSVNPVRAIRGDARAMPLDDASVDFVVTSPPYINVFNYHQHYRRSAEFLGHDILQTARSEIGSNRANRGNRFLTVIQYCLDMAAALRELWRVCKSDARVLFVVGHESNVLGVPFHNAEYITSIAEGAKAFKMELRQTRWYTNKFGARIREDLMHFTRDGERLGDWEAIARAVASAGLIKGLEVVPKSNRSALEDAIERVGAVRGIPLLRVNE